MVRGAAGVAPLFTLPSFGGCRGATPAARRLLSDAVESLALSGRGHDRLLKVARTIADLESADDVDVMHVAEAITYRAGEAQGEAAA